MNLRVVLFLIPGLIFGYRHFIEMTLSSDFKLQESGHIELDISNIRNNKGVIRIGMYTSEKGYPNHPPISFLLVKDSLAAGKLRLFIPVKEPGSFAFSILDDENKNEKMDYRLRIIPKEGFGFSNNPKIRGMKEPSFDETSIKYNGGNKVVNIRIVYIF